MNAGEKAVRGGGGSAQISHFKFGRRLFATLNTLFGSHEDSRSTIVLTTHTQRSVYTERGLGALEGEGGIWKGCGHGGGVDPRVEAGAFC